MKRGISCIAALALTLPSASAWAVTFTSNTTIGVGDTTYDGQDIIVSGCTLTVNGPHSFASLLLTNGGILTHAPAPDGETNNRLDLTIAGSVTIPTGSRIDVNGRGYGSSRGPGVGAPDNRGTGAGHGGYGGANLYGVSGGGTYGDMLRPLAFGSGGGSGYFATPGGAGGGLVRLAVGGTLTVDGVLSANGVTPGQWGGGGAGGSIWIEAGTLTGSGTITANGGNAGSWETGGGAGGRIAVYYAVSTFSGSMCAYGGGGAQGGGAGTVFRKVTSAPAGELLVDNGGNVYQNTPIATPVVLALTVTNGARPLFNELLTLSTLNVASNGLLRHATGLANAAIYVSGNASIAVGGDLNLNGVGYPAESGPGVGTPDNRGTGAGHGGWGGVNSYGIGGGRAYGNPLRPTTLGSGGGSGYFGTLGGAGGGALRLVVDGTLTVNGNLSANGMTPGSWGGGGAGGSLWIEAGTLTGAGTISANGGNAGGSETGGGAGGRIAIYCGANSFAGQVTAFGGSGAQGGGAGTVYRKLTAEPVGEVRVDNNFHAYTWTPLPAPEPFRLTLAGGAKVYPEWHVLLASLRIEPMATLSHQPGIAGVWVNVTGDATIDQAGEINVNGCGYGSASGWGAGTNGYIRGSGAGHGGRGGSGNNGLGGGPYYDSHQWPIMYGSGGGTGSGQPGGSGGGVIHLVVGGTLTVGGLITANGTDGAGPGYQGGGGSGGAILIETGSLVGTGAGLISAEGGDAGGPEAGGGAGGCVAIYQHSASTNGWPRISTQGGSGWEAGGYGPVYFSTNFAPLSVVTHLPTGVLQRVVDKVQVVFSSAANAGTFGSADVVFTTPAGPVAPGLLTVVPVGGSLFEIGFPPQSTPGLYQLQVGPQIQGLFGQGMDQNGNGTPGETPGDVYTGTFTIAQPTLSGTVSAANGWRLKNLTVRAQDGSATTTTDVNGAYTLTVAPGWSGSVAPVLAGGVFNPPSRAYLSLESSQTGQDFTLTAGLEPTLRAVWQGTNVAVSWPSLGGLTYQLKSSADFTNWTDLGAALPGNGATLNVSVPATNARCVFRVRVTN